LCSVVPISSNLLTFKVSTISENRKRSEGTVPGEQRLCHLWNITFS
jgi:hypothetical protein